ncbi:MAG: tetratricopeptide repeat protein [Bacteroidetes bacterium]|nr:tetratricopeptide repeat protein [Bacteroidota bacterium]
MKIRSLTVLSLVLFFTFSACKTQKKRGDIGPISKFYHNTTAEFNGYFNADVLLTESMLSLEQSYQDNYNKILPVYKYQAAENPRAVAGPLDQAIEKVTVVVSLHPYSHWTDDCYLLMGQAQFVKQDFEAAEETFEYMIAEFNPGTLASKKASSNSKKSKKAKKAQADKERRKELKRKKRLRKMNPKRRAKILRKEREEQKASGELTTENDKEEGSSEGGEEGENKDQEIGMISLGIDQGNYDDVGDGEKYGLKHRPSHQEGLLWLAKTYVERQDYPAAERIMGQLDRSPNTFEDVRRDLAALQAHYHIKRKTYENAVEHLERAIDLEKDKLKKARYTFIVAQIHEMKGRNAAAYEAYARVLKLRPGYEMTFSAQLNTIRSSWANGLTTSDEARKDLEKMTKDIKNIDYLDRIYFTLATIDLQEGNKEEAIANLRKSLNKSSAKSSQKADSYLTLADLYFEAEDFVNAKSYYDSTLTVMNDRDDNFLRVKKLSENLKDIASNIQIIQLQDSLLAISSMSEDEMRAFAFEQRQKENEARRQALLNKDNPTKGPRRPGPSVGPSAAGESAFFAYNDRALKRGERDFERNWADRPLVDNWRRSATIDNNEVIENQEELEIASQVITDEDIDEVLEDVPRSEADVTLANRKIEGALFALGRLYRDRLENNEKSIESLEEMLRRYPDSDQRVEAWYYLHLAHTDLGHSAEAQKYYDLIVTNNPNSTFAKILTDPSYASKMLDEQGRLNQAYNQVYAKFTAGNYQEAGQLIAQTKEEFGSNNMLQARFALLEAMIAGNKQGKEVYVSALKDVIARYPDSPESTRAREILRLLGAAVASGPGRQEVNPSDLTSSDVPFEVDEDATSMHYVIVVFTGDIQLSEAKVEISDFNQEYFKVDRLKVANMYLGNADERVPVVVVRKFNGTDKAMEYYQTVQQNMGEFLGEDFEYQVYPISQTNYRHVLRAKSVAGYDAFFYANYLN